MTWLTKKQVLSMTLFYLVLIFAHTLFFVFVTNYFKCALLALLFKKVSVRVWIFWLVFSVTFQSHFEKSCRKNLCSFLSLKDWPDLILGFALQIVKISFACVFRCVCVCGGFQDLLVGDLLYLWLSVWNNQVEHLLV